MATDIFTELSKKVGFGDLKRRARDRNTATARQCVFFYLHKSGYHYREIGKLGKRSRPDVIHNISVFQDLLDVKDKLALMYWNRINSI